jgi:hypothetical protein
MSAVGSHYHKTDEDTTLRRLIYVCAAVKRRVCELAIALYSLVVTSCVYKCAINPITYLNTIYRAYTSVVNSK